MMENSKIVKTDCIQGMNNMSPSSVDVVVTSPPYNIDVDYNDYDDNKDFDEYFEWMSDVAEGIERVLSDDGSFFLNVGDKPSDEFRAFEVAKVFSNYFELQNTIHWVKHISIPEEDVNVGHYKPVNSSRFLNNCHEYIFHFTKSGNVDLDKLSIGVEYEDKSNIDRYGGGEDLRGRGNMWFIPYETVSESKSHPAAFPIKLPEMCIKLHGLEDDGVVMDPFAGIGTTLVAAKRLGFSSVGFEIDGEYIEISKNRLSSIQTKIEDI